MRLFFAVPLSPGVKDVVTRSIEEFPVKNTPWRWIPPENFHLTLKFLGDVDEKLLPSLIEAGSRAVKDSESIRVVFGRFGGFPSLSRPRVLFYEVEEGIRELERLAGSLEGEVEGLGFEKERRPFRAHLTLARIKKPLPETLSDKLKSVPPLPPSTAEDVDRIVLMRSHLSREGARYEVVESFVFGGTV